MSENKKNTQQEITKPATNSLAPLWQLLSSVKHNPVHFILLFLALSEQVRALNEHRELPGQFDFSSTGISQNLQIYQSMLQETNITELRIKFNEQVEHNNHKTIIDVLNDKISASTHQLKWYELKLEFLAEHNMFSEFDKTLDSLPITEELNELRTAATLLKTIVSFKPGSGVAVFTEHLIRCREIYDQLPNHETAFANYVKGLYLLNLGLTNSDIRLCKDSVTYFKNASDKQPGSTLYPGMLDEAKIHYNNLLANRPINIFSEVEDIYSININTDKIRAASSINMRQPKVFSKEILACAQKYKLPFLVTTLSANGQNNYRFYIPRNKNKFQLYKGNISKGKIELSKSSENNSYNKKAKDLNFFHVNTAAILTTTELLTTEAEVENYLFKSRTDQFNNSYAAGNYPEALDLIKKLIEEYPSIYHLELQYTLAHTLGDASLLAETLSQLKKIHPDCDLLHAHYIIENISTNDPVVFKEMLEKNTKINSEKITSPFIHYVKGTFLTKRSVLSNRSDFAQGKFHLQKALELSPKSPLFEQGFKYANSVDLALNQTANFTTPNIYYTLYNTTPLAPTSTPSSFSKSAFELAKTHHLAMAMPPNTIGDTGLWRRHNPSIGNFLIFQNGLFYFYNGHELNQTICLEQTLYKGQLFTYTDIPDFLKSEIYAFIDEKGNIMRSEEELNFLYADMTYNWKNIGILLLAAGVTIISFLVYFYRKEIGLFFTADTPQREPITTPNITVADALEKPTEIKPKKSLKKKKRSSPTKNIEQTEQKEIEQREQENLLEQHITHLNTQLNTLAETEIGLDIRNKVFVIIIAGTQNCLLAQLPSKDSEPPLKIENNTPKFPLIPIDNKIFHKRLFTGLKELYKDGHVKALRNPDTQSPAKYIQITAPQKLPTQEEIVSLIAGISKAFIEDFIKTNKNDGAEDNNSKPEENKEEKKPASSYSHILPLKDIDILKSTLKELQDWHDKNKTKIVATNIEHIKRTHTIFIKSLKEFSEALNSINENNNNIQSSISYSKLKHLNYLSNVVIPAKEKLILALEKNHVTQDIAQEEINKQQQQRELFFNLHDQFLTVSAWLDTESNLINRHMQLDHIRRLVYKLHGLYDEVENSILAEEMELEMIDEIDLDTLQQLKEKLTIITETKNQLLMEFKILYDQEDEKLKKFKNLTNIKTKNQEQKDKKNKEKAEKQKKKEQDKLLEAKIQWAANLTQGKEAWLANVDGMFLDNRWSSISNKYLPLINQLLWLITEKPEQCELVPYLKCKKENQELSQNYALIIISNGLLYYAMRFFHALGQLLKEYKITSPVTFFIYARNKYKLTPATSHLLLFKATDKELKLFNAIELMYLIKNSLAYNFYYWLKNPTQLAKLGELLIIIENSLEKFKIEKETLRLDKNRIHIDLGDTDNIIFDLNQIHAILLDIRSSAKNEALTKEEVTETIRQQFATLSIMGNALWSLIEKNNTIDSDSHQLQSLVDKNDLLNDAIKGCITSLDQAIKVLAHVDPHQYQELSNQLSKHGQKLLVDKINTVRDLIRHEHKLTVAQVETEFMSIYIHPTEIDSFHLQRLARDAARFYEEYYLAPPLDAPNENSNSTNNANQNTNAESTEKTLILSRQNRPEPSPTQHIVAAMLKMKKRQERIEQKAELKEIFKNKTPQ